MTDNYISASKDALSQLNNLRNVKSARLAELKKYGEVSLKNSLVNNKSYYHAKKTGDQSYSYLGDDSNVDVQLIKEYRYLRQLVHDLDYEIGLIERFTDKHIDINFESVNSRIPAVYRSNAGISSNGMADAADQWKKEKEEEKSKFPVKNPEKLVMRAIDGTLVRSKSELVIANMFIANGIPYIYELPYVFDDITIYTDFTALSTIDYKTVIRIEHEGLMNSNSYQQQFLYKVNKYLSTGIIPSRDIFFTFDDLNGGFDPSPIQDIIDTRLKHTSRLQF